MNYTAHQVYELLEEAGVDVEAVSKFVSVWGEDIESKDGWVGQVVFQYEDETYGKVSRRDGGKVALDDSEIQPKISSPDGDQVSFPGDLNRWLADGRDPEDCDGDLVSIMGRQTAKV